MRSEHFDAVVHAALVATPTPDRILTVYQDTGGWRILSDLLA
jgi:hypothetical protein